MPERVDIPPGPIEERLAYFTEACRSKGLRMTPQRLAIFRELAATSEHPSVEAIYQCVRPHLPNISLDTVYRVLATLQDHGIISRVEVLDDRARYDANRQCHHHFVCVRCQKVEDVEWPALDRMSFPREACSWGDIDRVYAEIRGICRACTQTEEDG